MTTATRRLRRAGVAGLATITTVGGLLIATGGTALAWNGGAITPASTATNVFPGTTGAAGGDLTLTLPNVAWNIGDTITETIVNTNNCSTAANTVGFASAPTVTASLASGAASTDTKPTATVALSSSAGACTTAGVKDVLTITLTNSGDNSADAANGAPTLTLTPMKFNLGAGPITATTITLHGVVAGTAPLPTLADIAVANIKNTNVTVSGSVGASTGATINVGTITATDVTGTNTGADVTFTLSGATDVWATKGTLTGPSGVTIGTGTITTKTLAFPISGTIPAGAKFTLSGATATVNGAGSHTVTVTSKAGASTLGSAVQVAFVAAPTRIGGADRYATAALIYGQKYGAASSAVIASGANFPDALSATALAKAKSTGVLLTDPNTLSSATKQVLITSGPVTTVYIVGGPAAVSDNVVTQIEALKNSASNAINVVRVYGADRYATNAAVDLQAGVNLSTIGGNTAIVATGENFADALAVGPAIEATGWPLILTPSADLNSTAKSTIAALGIANAVIVGGPKAVSATAEASLKTAGVTVTNRLAGATRTLTAAEIAKWELTPAANTFAETGYAGNKGLGFSGTTVNIARGDTYPDALASGAWLGNAAVLQVLLLTDSPTALGAGIPAVLAGANAAPPAGYGTTNVNAIGLAAALSTPTVTAAVGAIS